jgi:translation initiation factor IF-2
MPGKRRGALLAVAAAAAALAAGLGLWAARSGEAPAVPAEAAPAASSVLDGVKPEPNPTETAAPFASVEQAPEPAPSAAIAVTPPAPVVSPAKVKPAIAAGKAPPKKPDPAKPAPTPAGGITDFGGRR